MHRNWKTYKQFRASETYLSDNLMLSFWASALQSDVLPVPGGP